MAVVMLQRRNERMTQPMRRILLCVALLAATSSISAAADYPVGEIVVGTPWTRAVGAAAPTAAGYMTFRNEGSAPDRLLSASTPMARTVELHEATLTDGIMRMRPRPAGIVLPPSETVRLEPGGLHAMLVGPTVAYLRGTRVPLTLRFERSGEVTVDLVVEARGARSPAHEGH